MAVSMTRYGAVRFSIIVFLCLCYVTDLHGATTTNLTLEELKCKLTVIDSQLISAKEMIETARKGFPTVAELNDLCNKSTPAAKAVDCSDIYLNGQRKDGVYQIWPQNRFTKGPLTVYCHMEADGGGWTVIQRRDDYGSPQDYFYQDWNAYKSGFGDLDKDFWIGNDNLFALTNQRAYQIKFDLEDWEKNVTYASYDEFWIDDELHTYTLHVKGYKGTAGDSFSYHNGAKFSTKDKDNDTYEKNCAVLYKGAWWYKSCHDSNLNGDYLKGQHGSYGDGVNWGAFRGFRYSLKRTVMKLRPTSFVNELNLLQ